MLNIFNASAGSGKTYTLVKNYILLTIKNYNNVKTILTITFTNQATQQIKNRILNTLYSLTMDSSSQMFKDIQATLFWKKKKIQKHARGALHFILHNYDFFNVSTIDSFLQSIIRSFNYELGIQFGYKIDIDPGNAIDFIIDDLLQKMQDNVDLSQWLSNFIKNNFQTEKTINIKTAIKQTVTNIFTEQFLKHENELPKNFEKLEKNITTIKSNILDFEKQMINYAQEILNFVQQNNFSIDDFSYKDKGIISFPLKIVKQKKFIPSERVLNMYNKPDKWFAKKEKFKSDSTLDILATKYSTLMIFFFNNIKEYQTNKTILKTFYFYGIINELLHSLAKYRSEKNTMLISDVSNLLKNITEGDEIEFIFEKVGTYYNHFFIDEFQDISEYQWINIKTLIENSLAQGYRNIIVGDVKQSIYRWRGGDSTLLGVELKKDFGRNAKIFNLMQNFRSAHNIVNYNNDFFLQQKEKMYQHLLTHLSSIDNIETKLSLTRFLQQMDSMYEHLEQDCYSKILGEVVSISIPNSEDAIEKIYEIIQTLNNGGENLKDITILVRTNLEGEKIMNFLLKSGINTISASASKLCKYLSVKLLVNCLLYFYNLNRTELVLFEIASFYKAYHNRDENILSFIDDVQKKIFSITGADIYQVCLELIKIFNLEIEEAVYTFLDVVNEYRDDEIKFDKWWKINGDRFSVALSDDINAVKIMTIHQSKGLEFKNVIIPSVPSFDDNINKSDLQWYNSHFGFLPVYYGKNLQGTNFLKDYYQEFIKRHYDNFNVIYVAFTRAKEKIFLLVQRKVDESDD